MQEVTLQSEYTGIQELIDNEISLINYTGHIINLTFNAQRKWGKEIPHGGSKILDFGAGIATLTEIYYKKTGISPLALEPDTYLQEIIRKKGFDVVASLNDLDDGKFDTIFSSNVLEHIEDDVTTLINLKEKLKEHGLLLLYLPAFNCLWTKLDDRVGHFRRYQKKDLKAKLSQAGFEIKQCFYVDSLGFLITMCYKLIVRSNKSNEISTRSLKTYDSIFFPISYYLDCLGVNQLMGKNIFVVASKT